MKTKKVYLITSSWVLMILVSAFPKIILKELFHIDVHWFPWVTAALALFLFVYSFFGKALSPLKEYFGVFFVIIVVTELIKVGRLTVRWREWFGGNSPTFIQYMLRLQLPLLLGILVVAGVLLLTKKMPRDFFLSLGNRDAEAKPVRWLAVGEHTGWGSFGVRIAIVMVVGIVAYLIYANGTPSVSEFISVSKYLPFITIFALLNAFYEELIYRASLLSTLKDVIGGRQALGITSVFFGLGHFYGVPSGTIGVFLAGFLGYILGKSMLETKGMFWALVHHFLMDFCIYIFVCRQFVV